MCLPEFIMKVKRQPLCVLLRSGQDKGEDTMKKHTRSKTGEETGKKKNKVTMKREELERLKERTL